jgi:hypothetical protein
LVTLQLHVEAAHAFVPQQLNEQVAGVPVQASLRQALSPVQFAVHRGAPPHCTPLSSHAFVPMQSTVHGPPPHKTPWLRHAFSPTQCTLHGPVGGHRTCASAHALSPATPWPQKMSQPAPAVQSTAPLWHELFAALQ